MELLAYLLFGSIVIFYLIYVFFRKKINVNKKIYIYSKILHYSCLILLSFNLILGLFDYSLRGNWTIKLLMWIFLLTSFIIQINPTNLKTKVEKLYFKMLLFAPTLLVVTWIIPMLGALTSYSFMLLFFTSDESVIYQDKQYVLSFEEGFLKHDYEFEVYKNNGIFKHKIKSVLLNEMNFDKIILVEEKQQHLYIKYREYDNQIIKDTLIFLNE